MTLRKKYHPRRNEVPNMYGCPQALWKKLDMAGRVAYNACMETGSSRFVPFEEKLTDAEWDVLDHNFAVYLAFFVDKSMRVE